MKRILTKISILVIVIIALAIGSTNRSFTSNVVGETHPNTSSILIVGSTALQPLAERAADIYTRENKGVSVTVQGGGSGAGLTQVQSGSVQIGTSDVFAEEKSGIDAKKISDHRVAIVGIAPVVNKDVNINNISSQDLRRIFTGQVNNWRQIGGPDLPITVINRASGSGTRSVFENSVLKGSTSVHAQEQDSNGTVQKIVSATPGSVSYLSFGYISGNNLKALKINNIAADEKNVQTGRWPIWGYEHMYTHGKAAGETAKFIRFFQSNRIQNGIVKDLGYIPLHGMQVEKNAKGEVSKR
ncbi:PstS family phosphate ABC transporter substrate-binding protein [Oenococcus alcoholitolerans]|uniref:PstS family phosphate ABC transporter substrate-binding protein n=1 Tax=Oenococcus alcoholitolerans TaxID=931074 RepID=UPI003F71B199